MKFDVSHNMDGPWKHTVKDPETEGQVWFHLNEAPEIGQFIETERWIEATRI